MASLLGGRGGRGARHLRQAAGDASPVRAYLVAAFVALAAVVQSALAGQARPFGVTPDLVLVFLTVWAAVARPRRMLLWGFGAGFLLDILSGTPAGTSMLALTFACYLASVGGLGLFRTSLVWALVAVLPATFVYYLITMILMATHGFAVEWGDAIARVLPAAAVVNALVAAVIYWPVTVLEKATRNRRAYRLY